MNILESQIFVKVSISSVNLNISPLINFFIDNYNDLEIISNYFNEMINNPFLSMVEVFEKIELSELEFFSDFTKEELMDDFIILYKEINSLIQNIYIKNFVYCNLNIEKPDTLILEYRKHKTAQHDHLSTKNISDSVYIRSFCRR